MTAAPLRIVRWRQAARDDLAEIVEYIAADSPDAAERVMNRILDRVGSLAHFPLSGAVCPYYPQARQLLCGNYVVYYTVSRRKVLVRAVVHGARHFRASWLRRK